MDLNLSEKEIIYILNCISITLNFMKWHNYEEKERIKMYFDNENYFEVLGTIGGDDTVLIILREGVSHKELLDALSSTLPNIHALYK